MKWYLILSVKIVFKILIKLQAVEYKSNLIINNDYKYISKMKLKDYKKTVKNHLAPKCDSNTINL